MPTYPHTISNGHGEEITFTGLTNKNGEECLELTNRVEKDGGPPMHVHYQQEERITVTSGTLNYQIKGQPPKTATAGDTVIFQKGIIHRFWNPNAETLICKGQVSPPLNFEYFISQIFLSVKTNTKPRPQVTDIAHLLHRFRDEFGMDGLPWVVRKVVFPMVRMLNRRRV